MARARSLTVAMDGPTPYAAQICPPGPWLPDGGGSPAVTREYYRHPNPLDRNPQNAQAGEMTPTAAVPSVTLNDNHHPGAGRGVSELPSTDAGGGGLPPPWPPATG